MNLLPFEPLAHHDNPAGIRIGTQEMTRVGMKEPEMEQIARSCANAWCRARKSATKSESSAASSRRCCYSFDDAASG